VDEEIKKGASFNGHLPERDLVTGVGPVKIRQPRVRHRDDQFSGSGLGKGTDRNRFNVQEAQEVRGAGAASRLITPKPKPKHDQLKRPTMAACLL
jgi:hypothetical protein